MPQAEPTATCFRCSAQTNIICPRCGRPYCPEHGAGICAGCADPGAALPSAGWYRGSVLALVVAATAGLWLTIAPPDLTSSDGGGEPAGDVGQPVATATASEPTAGPNATASPAATSMPAGETYLVQPGDTLAAIAELFGTSVEELTAANGIAPDAVIQPGQELVIPQ